MTARKQLFNSLLFFVVFALAGNALTGLYEFQQRQNLKNAPHTDFFSYIDIEAEPTYFVGEPIKFTTVRTAVGEYEAQYTDKIFCPEDPKNLEHVTRSFGSVKDTGGEVERSTWTYGSFIPGEKFTATTIDEPRKGCIIESTIVVQVGGDTEKRQNITGSKKFNIIERE